MCQWFLCDTIVALFMRLIYACRMANSQPKVLSPRVSTLLNRRLQELGITRSDFIRKFNKDHGEIGSRNHLFKVLNGQAIVGEHGLLPYICKSLGLDYDEVVKLVRRDKITAKEWETSLPKASKIAQEVATVLESLKPRDQEEVLKFAKMKAGLL